MSGKVSGKVSGICPAAGHSPDRSLVKIGPWVTQGVISTLARRSLLPRPRGPTDGQAMEREDMRTFNRATIMGHVGNEVIMRRTQTGKPVVNLNLATEQRRKEGESSTTWHRVVLWDRLAELCEKYVERGHPVWVEGPITTREFVDVSGVKHQRTEVVARELIFMNQPPNEDEGESTDVVRRSGQRANDGEELQEVRQEIPF